MFHALAGLPHVVRPVYYLFSHCSVKERSPYRSTLQTRFLIPTVSQLTLPFTFTELLFVVRLSVLIHASILLRPQKSLISPLSLTLQSIPQTRLRLQRMMIGLPDQPGSDHWEDERNPGDDDYAHSSGKRSGSSPQNKGKRKH